MANDDIEINGVLFRAVPSHVARNPRYLIDASTYEDGVETPVIRRWFAVTLATGNRWILSGTDWSSVAAMPRGPQEFGTLDDIVQFILAQFRHLFIHEEEPDRVPGKCYVCGALPDEQCIPECDDETGKWSEDEVKRIAADRAFAAFKKLND